MLPSRNALSTHSNDLFSYGPARFQQGYAIAISVLLVRQPYWRDSVCFSSICLQALVFTKIPEYTTWAVLLALALYGTN